jgi:zeaxanthin glucosyltransferase
MARIAILCMPAIGHLKPMAAIGRALMRRGHDVAMCQVPTARARVKAAGLRFIPLGGALRAPLAARLVERAGWPLGKAFSSQAERVLAGAVEALGDHCPDVLIGDHVDMAAVTVAEHLRLPYAAVSVIPPLHLDPSVPPPIFGWRYEESRRAEYRNRAGNAIMSALLAPTLRFVNARRKAWRLAPFRDLNDVFARAPLVTQLPEALEFPRRHRPDNLRYTGPFIDGQGEYGVEFPWERLGRQPSVYASMGTLQNGDPAVFRAIAAACAALDVQLVLALGGGLHPDALGPLPGDPVVVPYAPQMQVLARASAVITHGGMNTTLEALLHGLPLVAVPVTDDQPGVSARIAWAGVGEVVPLRRLTPRRLHDALRQILTVSRYRTAAARLQRTIANTHGLDMAVRFIEARCLSSVDVGIHARAGES